MRAWLDAGLVHVGAARVEAWDGETEHHEVNEEGDVVVHCKMHSGGTPVKANLGPMAGSRGAGVWLIPDAGTEVVVASDNGNFEGELYLIAMHPTGNVPAGLVPGKVLVIGTSVEVRTFDGTPERGPRFETYRTREDTMFSAVTTMSIALDTFIAAQAVYNAAIAVAVPALLIGGAGSPAAIIAAAAIVMEAATVALGSAISTFQAQGPTYLATVLKNE